jgi:hypothetical protein
MPLPTCPSWACRSPRSRSRCTTTTSACDTWCSRWWPGWSGAISSSSRRASGPRGAGGC